MSKFALLVMAVACLPGAELRVVPTFENASVYLEGAGRAPAQVRVRYRASGADAWQDAHPLAASDEDPAPRGSLFGLRADTAYEAECLADDRVLAGAAFRTWSDAPPIARTVRLTASGPLRIHAGGDDGGWVRYIADPGVVVEGGADAEEALLVDGVSRVLLDGLTIRGGRRHGVRVRAAREVRVRGCDIAGWGRVGRQDLAREGKFYDADPARSEINFDAGVFIDGSAGTVVERTWIHDPRGRANSWLYAHPAGPTAIYVRALGGTVVRWNDLVGGDAHRWNDVIEGYGNGDPDGGFNRDADIYGNLLAYGNDDGIELDGGQCNVRLYGNRIEGTLCGISTAPNKRGPSFVIANLIAHLGDERGIASAVVKNGGGTLHSHGTTFFYHNTAYSAGTGITAVGFGNGRRGDLFLGEGRNNLLALTGAGIRDPHMPAPGGYDHDLLALPWGGAGSAVLARASEVHGVRAGAGFADAAAGDWRLGAGSPGRGAGARIPGLASFQPPGPVDVGAFPAAGGEDRSPWRPIPVRADPGRLALRGTPASLAHPVTVTLAAGPGWTAQPFAIAINDACAWLRVEPAQGVLPSGGRLALRVSVVGAVPDGLGHGAFLVRFPDGVSVPVLVTAASAPIAFVRHAEAEALADAPPAAVRMAPDAGGGSYLALAPGIEAAVEVEVPAAGWYTPWFRIRSPAAPGAVRRLRLALDGAEPRPCTLGAGGAAWYWTTWDWAKHTEAPQRALALTAGRHRLAIGADEAIDLDAFMLRTLPLRLDERGDQLPDP